MEELFRVKLQEIKISIFFFNLTQDCHKAEPAKGMLECLHHALHTKFDCSFMIHEKAPEVTLLWVVLILILITDNEDHESSHDSNVKFVLCALQREIHSQINS
jgi:hypothetical protein